MNKTFLRLAVVLVAFGAFYRVFRPETLPGLPNFSPVMAIAFSGALFLPAGLSIIIPLAALLLSDLTLNFLLGEPLVGWEMLPIYACYAFAIVLGRLLREKNLTVIFGATILNALVFYVVTNSLAWFDLGYAKTAAGWWQSLTVGLPGHPPTWLFFRNSLAGDLIFTGVFVAAYYLARNRSASPNLCRQESSL